jgi:hypothetical protein
MSCREKIVSNISATEKMSLLARNTKFRVTLSNGKLRMVARNASGGR